MPCTVCGVGSKRTVREYSAELNIVRYSISVCVYIHFGGCGKVERKLGVFYKCVGVG